MATIKICIEVRCDHPRLTLVRVFYSIPTNIRTFDAKRPIKNNSYQKNMTAESGPGGFYD